MSRILIVCTGNICRSPMAAGFLRRALVNRFGEAAPEVGSAGTAGWEGSAAMPESTQAAAERGVDIGDHVARLLDKDMVRDADLIVCMAAEHRDAIVALVPEAEGITFTLKELVRLLDQLPPAPAGGGPGELAARVLAASEVRREGGTSPWDEDVADPLGQPVASYRAIAWELDELMTRMVDGLFGPAGQDAARTG
jgi:low molecular weight protein-tyrosine phosphatase